MIRSKKSQAGMTFISIVALLVLVGFVLMSVVKVLPGYLESFKVASALTNLTEKPNIASSSNREIKDMLLKKLQVDDVESVTSDHIKIESGKTERTVSIEYEYRVNIISNIDAVVVIGDNAVKVPK